MNMKFVAGLIILFIGLVLQFWFASSGWQFDLSFAALISLAFVFDIWQLLTLVLLAVFVVNWQPAASVEIVFFALYPVAVHFTRHAVNWHVWLQDIAAVALGALLMHLIVGHGVLHLRGFIPDLTAMALFGALSLAPLYRWI